VYKAVNSSVYVILASSPSDTVAQGSGVAVGNKHLVTNGHVVADGNAIVVAKGESAFTAVISHADVKSDRCLLRVVDGAVTPIKGVRRFEDLTVGERVFAVGSPRGLENSLSEGLISGLREENGIRYIQTSASISPGSSGGGLFDAAGNLIGVTTLLVRDSQNLNFAIAAIDYWN
jgi:S1-C subfamily serine protease